MIGTYDFLRSAGLTAELHSLADLQKPSSECSNYYCNSIPCTSNGYVGKNGRWIGIEETETCPHCGGTNLICVVKSKPDKQ